MRVTHGGLRRIAVSTQALGRRAALRTFAVRGLR